MLDITQAAGYAEALKHRLRKLFFACRVAPFSLSLPNSSGGAFLRMFLG